MHVIPELEKINPRAVEALAAGAGLLRDEAAVADAQCEPVLAGVLTSDGGTVRIDRERFLALLPALRRRALRKAAASLGGDLHRFSLIHTEEATSFMEEAQTGRAMELPGGLILERSYGEFVVRPGAELPPFSAALPVPGATLISEVFLSVTAEVDDLPRGQEEKGNYLWQAEFDYAKIALPLLVRNRRDGDRLCPAGMGGRSKKLQDLFVDEKVPFSRRSSIPVLATEHDILWVMGMRTDERFLPGPDTKKVLRVTVTEEPVRGTK
jgi:tRNA(Ile)-lysidine synthase